MCVCVNVVGAFCVNVVWGFAVQDTGELSACAVLELCSAGTLADTAVCGLEFGPVADVARQLATALEYLHIQGYVYASLDLGMISRVPFLTHF